MDSGQIFWSSSCRQGEAREAEDSWSSWQVAELLANLRVSLVSALTSWTGSDKDLVPRAATTLQPLLQTSSILQLL